jgi:hypothetical protein
VTTDRDLVNEEKPGEGKLGWKRAHFERFLDDLEEADRLRYLTNRGIESLSHQGDLVETLASSYLREEANYDPAQYQEVDRRAREDPAVLRARQVEAMAREEVERDFRLVHANAIVDMWGALESLFDDIVVAALVREPDRLRHERLARLKVPVGLLTADDEERARLIYREYMQSVGADLKVGPGRFEVALDLLDLSGPIEANLRRTLREIHQVRNLYAHRRGVVDSRFTEACPWTTIAIGDRFEIDSPTYDRFHGAIVEYVVTVINRLRIQVGLSPVSAGGSAHEKAT